MYTFISPWLRRPAWPSAPAPPQHLRGGVRRRTRGYPWARLRMTGARFSLPLTAPAGGVQVLHLLATQSFEKNAIS